MTLPERAPNVRLIGPVRIETGSLVTAGFRSNRVSALLAYLCFREGGAVLREEIAEALWPQLGSEAARNNLRVTLRYLRQALEAHDLQGALRTDERSRLSLDDELVVSDAAMFWSLERQGRDEEAVALAGAALLPGLNDAWIEPFRTRFGASRSETLGRLAAASLDVEPLRALELATLGLADDPLDARARGIVAEAHLRLGDPAAAAREMAAYRALLRTELGEALPIPLEALLVEAEKASVPAVATRPIPVERTRFYGREAELAAIEAWAGGEDRLLTVYGPGGIGKSRLGAEASVRLGKRTTVLWIDAAGATTRGALLDLVARGLGSGGAVPGSALGHIVAMLHDREALIVLDNLESVPDEDLPVVDELLARLPLVQALGLSRKTLGLPGERTLRLDPLPLPQTPDDLDAPALALLLDRAGGLTVDADLIDLARALEGIPLAIELAAAKASALGVRELLDGMQARLDVLVGRSARHARHRAMRSTLDWSFDLLEPAMRDAILDLAVLRNAWTLDAANALLGGGDRAATREVLETACTNSLLVRTGVGPESWYGMLECTRDYAIETLPPSRRAELRSRHADHFLAFVLSAPPLERLEREEPNLEAALEWFAESPERMESLLAFGEGLLRYWIESSAGRAALRILGRVEAEGEARVRLLELRARLFRSIADFDGCVEAVVAALTTATDPRRRSRLLALLSRARRTQGRLEESFAAACEAVELGCDLAPAICADALLVLAQVKSIYDLDPAAFGLVERAVCAAEATDDPYRLDETLDMLRLLHFQRGEIDLAERVTDRQEALPLVLNFARQAERQIRRAQVAISRGDLAEGRVRLESALALSRAAAHPWWLGQSLAQLGDTYTKLGLYDLGWEAHAEGVALRRRIGERRGLASGLRGMGMASYGLGESERAFRELGEAKALGEAVDERLFLSTLLIPYARAAIAAGHLAEARDALAAEIATCARLGLRPELAGEIDLVGLAAEARALRETLDH